MSCHGVSWHIMPCRVMACGGMSCHNMLCRVMPCHGMSYRVSVNYKYANIECSFVYLVDCLCSRRGSILEQHWQTMNKNPRQLQHFASMFLYRIVYLCVSEFTNYHFCIWNTLWIIGFLVEVVHLFHHFMSRFFLPIVFNE